MFNRGKDGEEILNFSYGLKKFPFYSKFLKDQGFGERKEGNKLINDEKRKVFGEYLKGIFQRNRFRQTVVASHLNISRQRLGLVCAGKTPLPDRLFNRVYDLLRESGVKEKDLKELSRLFVESKVSIPGSLLGLPDELFKTATELRDYMDLEKALAKSLDIVSHERDFDRIMKELVELVGVRTGSHFCAVYQYENNYSCARMIYEWHGADTFFDPEPVGPGDSVFTAIGMAGTVPEEAGNQLIQFRSRVWSAAASGSGSGDQVAIMCGDLVQRAGQRSDDVCESEADAEVSAD